MALTKDQCRNHFIAYFKSDIKTLALKDITINHNGKAYPLFLLENFGMDVGTERLLFALFHAGNLWKRRFFWKSGSTGVWRVGTGFDEPQWDAKQKRYEGRFKKGMDESVGYVHETQTYGKLDGTLTKFYEKLAVDQKILAYPRFLGDFFFDSPQDVHQGVTKQNIVDYFCKKEPGKSLWDEYVTEVKYEAANLFTDRSLLPNQETGKVDPKSYVEPDSVRKPMDVLYKTGRGVTTFQRSHELSKLLKEDLEIWRPVVNCLDHPCPGESYLFHFDLLGQNVNVEVYEILNSAAGKIGIEIAYTASDVTVNYTDGKGAPQARTSRLCWIKSVFFSSDLSNFGNYKQYPYDLSFLPQKPMDYGSQIDKDVLRKKYQQPISNYYSLVIYNEKYNHLIRAFKRLKNFQFLYDEAPVLSDQQTLINQYNHQKSVIAYTIQYLAISACNEYIDYHSQHKPGFFSFSSHGKDGISRTNAFKNKLETIDTFGLNSLDSIDKILKDFIVNNTINNKAYSSGGVSDYSFFTFLLNRIHEAVIFGDGFIQIKSKIPSFTMHMLFYLSENHLQRPFSDKKVRSNILDSFRKL